MLTLPFMMREPIDLPPIVSVELIEITDITSIPFAPKARKIIEKVKEEKKRVVSEQAPPASKAKEKPDRIPMPEDKEEIKELIKKKQNPEEIKPKIRQASEFEKEELFDTNAISVQTLETATSSYLTSQQQVLSRKQSIDRLKFKEKQAKGKYENCTWSASKTVPNYQLSMPGKLFPDVVQALQEAMTRIETLEAEVTALKG